MQLKLTKFSIGPSPKNELAFFRNKKGLTCSIQQKSTINIKADSQKITFKNMQLQDIKMALTWAEKEKWNPGKYEAEALYLADPKGYFLLKENNSPVATLAAIKYSQNYGFLGLYIVKEEYRGKGYGIQLWNTALEQLKECSSIGLNAVLSQINNYQKFGFNTYATNTRWVGVPKHTHEGALPSLALRAVTPNEEIFNYDESVSSISRKPFLKAWLTMPNAYNLKFVEDGQIKGYGAISKCVEGYKIAPLYADNFTVAMKLFTGLSKLVGEEKSIQLDSVDNNPLAAELAKNFGLFKTFTTARMYRGKNPQIDIEKIYGLNSLEIG